MILSGNRDALNPILDAIRALVNQLSVGHEDHHVPDSTLWLVLLALGDSLLGGPIAQALGLERDTARKIAADALRAQIDEQHPSKTGARPMIIGAHAMIFTKDEAADRAFLRDVLEIPCIDSGGGWLIFKLPPAEMGVHSGENGFHQLYFICDDIDGFVADMAAKGVETQPIASKAGAAAPA